MSDYVYGSYIHHSDRYNYYYLNHAIYKKKFNIPNVNYLKIISYSSTYYVVLLVTGYRYYIILYRFYYNVSTMVIVILTCVNNAILLLEEYNIALLLSTQIIKVI